MFKNEAYRIETYPKARRGKQETRVKFPNLNYGYAGDPVVIEETKRLLLIQKLPTNDWSGLGETSYYGPELAVAVRLPKGLDKPAVARGRTGDLVVVVFDKGYTRQTRTAAFTEGRKVMAKYEGMTDAQVVQLFLNARSSYASVYDDLDEIREAVRRRGKDKRRGSEQAREPAMG